MSPAQTIKGRPDYYMAPTRDFTQYTRDCEKKYWRKETAFDWEQDIQLNLKNQPEQLSSGDHSKIIFLVMPMLMETITLKMDQTHTGQLPMEEDAPNDLKDYLPTDKTVQAGLSYYNF